MSNSRSNLPKETVLCIIQYISNWEDRCQFVLASKYHWSCNADSVQSREVDLNVTNLIKLKIARGLRLVSSFRLDEGAAKAFFRKISICRKLRMIVVSGNTFAPAVIKKILRSASMKHRMEIVVNANSYTEWAKILDDQKFKSGIIDLQCDIDDEDLNRKSSNDMSNFDAYPASVNF